MLSPFYIMLLAFSSREMEILIGVSALEIITKYAVQEMGGTELGIDLWVRNF
jgi:hypothetical protein